MKQFFLDTAHKIGRTIRKNARLSRVIALILVTAITLPLISTVQGVATSSALNPTQLAYNTATATASDSAVFSTAFVRNKGGTARTLEVVLNLEAFSSKNEFYAVVMKASDYTAQMPAGPGPKDLGQTTYYQISGLTAANYGIARGFQASAAAGATLALNLVAPSSSNSNTLGTTLNGVNCMNFPVSTSITGTNYYTEYVLVVFAEKTGVADGPDKNAHYYIDHFYLDPQGYVRTPSYAIRYNANNPTTGSGTVNGTPGYQMVRATWDDWWASDKTGINCEPAKTKVSSVNASNLTRTGYLFVGWTTEARPFLAADAPIPTHDTDRGFYAPGNDYDMPTKLDTVYDLYALWQVAPIKFSRQASDYGSHNPTITAGGATVGGKTYDLVEIQAQPKVGVAFAALQYNYAQPDGDDPQPVGTRRFSGTVYTGANLATARAETLTTNSSATNGASSTTYGMRASQFSGSEPKTWTIAGTPINHSYNTTTNAYDPVWFLITVQDLSNNTSDTIMVKLVNGVAKGSQEKPDKDVNTGLETTVGAEGDGQIFGMYSAGQTVVNGKTNGTGTYTAYYETNKYVYAYRPKKVNGSEITDWSSYPYRTVPMKKGNYSGATLTAVQSTMTLESDKDLKITVNNKQVQKVEAVAHGADGAKWPKEYGSIEWDAGGLPVIHGLAEGDQYDVIFQENANFSQSEPVTLTISAGGGSMSGSGPADPSDFAPVVLYDWDGTTVLGSFSVAKADPEAAKATIEEYTASLYPEGYNPEAGIDGVLYNAASPLTSKKGYSFGKWIQRGATYEDGSEVFTIYGDAIAISSASQVDSIETPPDPDFSDLSQGLILLAAYKPNAEMVQSTAASDREYVITWDSFDRHDAGNSYSIKVRVQRELNGVGVYRCRQTALRVTMSSGSTQINALLEIQNLDDQIVEIAAPPTVDSVSASVIDIGGVANWVNGTTVRSRPYTVQAGTTESQTGYVFEGNLVYINKVLAGNSAVALAATHYSVAGLNVSKGNVHGTTATGGGALRTQAQANLQAAYNAKNANGTSVGLTWTEMRDAIKDGTLPSAVP